MIGALSSSDDTQTVITLVAEIMGAITKCRTGAEIGSCARHYAGALKILGASDAHKVRVIHIKNYAALRRKMIMAGADLTEKRDTSRACVDCGHWIAPFGVKEGRETKRYCGDCRLKDQRK